jgi:hypothetical protein
MEKVKWTTATEARFNELRFRELTGVLSDVEKSELAQLMESIEIEETEQLASIVTHMQSEQVAMRVRLNLLHDENTELAKVLSQLEQLVVDARKWLAEFERRHSLIRQSYAQITGVPVIHP